MATPNTAFRTRQNSTTNHAGFTEAQTGRRFHPRPVLSMDSNHGGDVGLRLYTEQQVSEILQLSRSQLRKWRMGWSRGKREGPPFKKIGRVIRYPESGLRAYIDAE